jgi:hypothetical protein
MYSAKVIRRWGLEAMRELIILHNAGLESILGNGDWGQGFLKRGKGERGKGRQCGLGVSPSEAPAVKGKELLPIPNAQCPSTNH